MKGEDAITTAAHSAWPEIDFEDAAFIAYLRASAPRWEAASASNAGDLLLAHACACGHPGAIRIVERLYLVPLAATLPERQRGDAVEIVQILRERMFVPEPGAEPRIATYTGRGAMGSWLRVAAVRIGMNLQRARRREVMLDEDGTLADRAGADLAIDDLKRRYRAEFRTAFTAALRSLAPRDRTILKQHYLDGLRMEAIGALYRVHRITVVRWMEAARVALAQETRRELGARLQIDRVELESILRLIESQMDMSIRAFLEKE